MKKCTFLTIVCLIALTVVLSPKAHALGGAGTESDPYVITTVSDLHAMHDHLDAYYVLGANINVSGHRLTPVGNVLEGAFTGTLDGKGYTISNLTMNLEDAKFVGLFGYLEGTVTNVRLSNATIIGGRYVGGIAGEAGVGSSITGCAVLSGAITSPGARITTNVGGIAGACEGDISGCTNGAVVQAHGKYSYVDSFAGGIVGYYAAEDGAVKSCGNSGAVSAEALHTASYGGGIIGYAASPVIMEDCVNSGECNAGSYSGGMLGEAYSTISLFHCANHGQVTGSDFAGGMIGGAVGKSTLQDCRNTAYIHSDYASRSNIGGMIGYAFSDSFLTDCTNSGYIYGYWASGLLCTASSGSIVTSCENTGKVSSSQYASQIYPFTDRGTVSEDSHSVIVYAYMTSPSHVSPGASKKLSISLIPASQYSDSIVWSSSDESIATVSPEGIVTGRQLGTVTITAETTGVGIRTSCTVTVVPSLTLDRTELTLQTGFTAQLTPVRDPETTDSYTWSSNASAFATVNNSGLVTAVKAGTSVITVTASSGLTATCTVHVVAPNVPAESVKLSQTLLRPVPGEKAQLTATVAPANATNQSVTWESSAPEVASVNGDGVVEALTPGDAVITVRTANGLYDTCQVKVVQLSSAAFVVADSRGAINGSFDTPVQLVKNPGIAAFTMEVQYDSSVLTPVSVTPSRLLSNGTLSSNIDTAVTDGKLRVTWYSAADITGDGPAFTVTWQAADQTGAFPVSLSYGAGDICNADRVEVRVAAESGTAYVLDRPVGDIYPDGQVNMKDIVYFARYFNEQEALDHGQRLAADLCFDGQIDVKDLTALAQLLSEEIAETASSSPAQMFSLMDMDETPHFKITVADAAVKGNENVALAVTGENCTGIAAFRFRVEAPEGYEVLELLPDALLSSGTFAYNADTGIVTWYSPCDQMLNGTLFTIILGKTGETNLPVTVELAYSGADFFSAADYSDVAVAVTCGKMIAAEYVSFGNIANDASKLYVTFDTNMTQDARLIAAFYQNGRVVAALTQNVNLTEKQCQVSLPIGSLGLNCKVFLLKQNSYTPLTKCEELIIK